jgi:gluconolactonase
MRSFLAFEEFRRYLPTTMSPVIPIEGFSVFATNLDHPECLAFDRTGHLYAGGEAGQIYRVAPEGGVATQLCALGGFTGGIAFTPDDVELLVCNPQHGLLMVRKDGSHRVFATHAGDHKLICPNYPVFAPDGSLYVTDSGNWRKRNGLVLRYTPDGRGEILTDPLGYTNGLALTPDGRTLYMVESDTNSIHRFTLSQNGAASAPSLFASNAGWLPDGLALDAAGNLLCSCYASDDVHRYTPAGEYSLLAHDPFAILLSRPTNMAFGGPNFDDLFFANLGRTTITRVHYGTKGQPLANQR